MYSIPSAYGLHPRPPLFFSGRADNACTNLLGFLVRYVRTRGIVEIAESAKPPIFDLSFVAHTCHAWLARLTRARGGCFLRGRKALLNDFWYTPSRRRRSEVASPPWTLLLVMQKYDKRKVTSSFFSDKRKEHCKKICICKRKRNIKKLPSRIFSRKNLQNAFPHKIIPFFKQF